MIYLQLRQEFSLCRVYKKTKCLRAFDRRPTSVENINFNPTLHDDHEQAHGYVHLHLHQEDTSSAILSHQIPPPPPVPANSIIERTSSHEDSTTSSGGCGSGGQPCQSGESSQYLNFPGEINEALWDWDHMNFI